MIGKAYLTSGKHDECLPDIDSIYFCVEHRYSLQRQESVL